MRRDLQPSILCERRIPIGMRRSKSSRQKRARNAYVINCALKHHWISKYQNVRKVNIGANCGVVERR